MKKQRIDILIVEQGLAESRNKAQRLVMAGEVLVNGQMVHKASELFSPDCEVTITNKPRYVSRGGYKLEKAINSFTLGDLNGLVCADIGASTGGFTDCLLQNGVKKVYAIDVGYGQLHQSLRDNPRVIEMERNNIKAIAELPDEIDLVVIDVSFISLKRVLPVIMGWNKTKAMRLVALVKPQFEVGKKIAAAGKGVIRKEEDRIKVLKEITKFSIDSGFKLIDETVSPIKGPKGNIEYLMYLKYNPIKVEDIE